MRAAAQAVRGGLSSRGSARVFKGVFAGVKISPRCQNAIYTRWHTRQAVAVTPTVHQRRHEPKPPFDHTCSTAPQPCDCSTTSHTFHCIIIYCCFTHFAYTINYGCWDLNNLQAAGFIFLAKLRVSNSIHQLLHLDMFFFFSIDYVCAMFAACSFCAQSLSTHTLTSARCRIGWCERAKFSYLSMMTGSDGVSFLLPQLFLSQHRLRGGERRCKDVLVTDIWTGVQN